MACGAYDVAAGRRGREGQGQRLPGPQRASRSPRRHDPHTHRGRHVLHGRAGLRPTSTASTRRPDARGARPRSRRRTTPTGRATRGRSSARNVSVEEICAMPPVAGELSVFDCAGVADGSGRGDRRARRGRAPLHRPAASTSRRCRRWPATARASPTRITTTRRSPRSAGRAREAYAQAGITDPRRELAMAEVHDCFTITELILWRTWGSPSGARPGRTCSPAPSTSTASCRSTPTAA